MKPHIRFWKAMGILAYFILSYYGWIHALNDPDLEGLFAMFMLQNIVGWVISSFCPVEYMKLLHPIGWIILFIQFFNKIYDRTVQWLIEKEWI